MIKNLKHGYSYKNKSLPFVVFSLIFVAVLSLWQSVANAGEYFLIERESYQLCHDLVKNFNRFKDEEPMVCELKFHPDYKNFRLPKWEEIDGVEHFDTVKKLLREESLHPWGLDDLDKLKERFGNSKNKLYRTKMDVNFDGHQNIVYRIKQNVCDVNRYFKFSAPGEYRYFAEPNFPDKKHPKTLGGFNGKAFGTAFYYKGRPYFHSWIQYPLFTTDKSRSIEGPSPRIAVYETSSPRRHYYESFGHKPVCEIGYRK